MEKVGSWIRYLVLKSLMKSCNTRQLLILDLSPFAGLRSLVGAPTTCPRCFCACNSFILQASLRVQISRTELCAVAFSREADQKLTRCMASLDLDASCLLCQLRAAEESVVTPSQLLPRHCINPILTFNSTLFSSDKLACCIYNKDGICE